MCERGRGWVNVCEGGGGGDSFCMDIRVYLWFCFMLMVCYMGVRVCTYICKCAERGLYMMGHLAVWDVGAVKERRAYRNSQFYSFVIAPLKGTLGENELGVGV